MARLLEDFVTFRVTKDDLTHPKVAAWYLRYISSKKWNEFSHLIYKLRGRKCEQCGETLHTIIHHLTYVRVTQERNYDVKILCKECHKLAHFKKLIPYAERIYDENDPIGARFRDID